MAEENYREDSGNDAGVPNQAPGAVPPSGAAWQQQQQPYVAPTQPSVQQPYMQPQAGTWQQPRSATPMPPKKPKREGGFLKQGVRPLVAGLIGGMLGCALVLGGTSLVHQGPSSSVTIGGSGSSITVSGEDATLAEVVSAKASPSVVSITNYARSGGLGRGSSGNLAAASSGSGVVISAEGYVVTNYHVIEGASELHVFAGSDEYVAKVVGADQSSDLAVLKIDADDLTAIEVGSSADVSVGEWCMAIGSAFGLGKSVSSGIVSATNCNYAELNSDAGTPGSTGSAIYSNLVQTDAAVNPGNSGGALVDAQGRLIGITTLGATYSGDNSGVNFAIPVDYVIDISQQIIDGKTPSHAQLGVSMVSVTETMASQYDLPVSQGAYVNTVASGSAAQKAGIEQGDIIVRIGQSKVADATDAILQIRSHKAGDQVEVTVNRHGSETTLDVVLGSDS